MKAYLNELQAHLLGNVTDSEHVREYFSTDGSIFKIMPEAVVYPRNTADVRKTVKYASLRTAAGKPMSIVGRGRGTDQGGGAVGEGLQLVFPAHMNRLIGITKNTVTVQPGMLYDTLQQILKSHGRFLPPAPASAAFCTIGGAVANNSSGELTLKYGSTRDYIKSMRVVLSDGSIIEARRLSSRELSLKKGQMNLEGEIYRKLDSLIIDHDEVIQKSRRHTSKNSAGYALENVRGQNGSFDLTQLLTGSQGTLGIITEITLRTERYNPDTTLVVGYFSSLERAGEAVRLLTSLHPAALEFVDSHLLEFLQTHRPGDLKDLLPAGELPQIVLLCEFNDRSRRLQTALARSAEKLMRKYATGYRIATDPIEQAALWKIRHGAAAVIWTASGPRKALPFIEDSAVSVAKLPLLIKNIYKLLAKHGVEMALWGHAGDGNIHLQPLMDLSKKRDVERIFALSREFYTLVAALGGTSSAEHSDGLIRSPYLRQLYGDDVYELFRETKHIFDPYGILNPHKKVDATEEYARQHLRTEYSMKHLYDHLPRA
jgi:FAD/FMN-containing dehydrogenase